MITPQTQGTIIYTEGDIFLIKTEDDYVLESWGASTKHPDSLYFFSDWEDRAFFFESDKQVFQWILYIASRTLFPFHAKEKTDFALKVYDILNK